MISTILWVIGTLGIGGALMWGAIAYFGFVAIKDTLVGKIAAGLAFVGLVAASAYLKGDRDRAAKDREKEAQANDKFLKQRAEAERRIDDLSDDDLDRRLHDPKLD